MPLAAWLHRVAALAPAASITHNDGKHASDHMLSVSRQSRLGGAMRANPHVDHQDPTSAMTDRAIQTPPSHAAGDTPSHQGVEPGVAGGAAGAGDAHIRLTERRLLGIGLICAAIFCFSLLDTTAKWLGTAAGLPVLVVIWVRFGLNIAWNAAMLGPTRMPQLLWHSRKPGLQLLRSVFMLGATLFNFFAVTYLRLDQTVTIFFLTPLIVAALAGPVLGEWVGWRRLLAICVGFLGVLFVAKPGFGGVHWAISLSFCSTISYALYNLMTRYLASHDESDVTVAYTPMVGFVVVAPFALATWVWPSDVVTWLLLGALGILGSVGHYLLIRAHAFAPASTLSPFVYTGLIWMIALGYLIFGDLPDVWTLAGGGIVISSGLYLLYREQKVGVELPGPAATRG